MILTPVAPGELFSLLGAFASRLCGRHGQAVFARLRRSHAERAAGARAEAHLLRAMRLGRALGLTMRPGSPTRNFGWDGRIMRSGTEAYVLLHEIAHYQLAPLTRRRRREFGLGPGPETGCRGAAKRAALVTDIVREREEAMASLLGILWEVELGQPALASFLDQNWLEGAGRPGAAVHFETTLAALISTGLVTARGRPLLCLRLSMRNGT